MEHQNFLDGLCVFVEFLSGVKPCDIWYRDLFGSYRSAIGPSILGVFLDFLTLDLLRSLHEALPSLQQRLSLDLVFCSVRDRRRIIRFVL